MVKKIFKMLWIILNLIVIKIYPHTIMLIHSLNMGILVSILYEEKGRIDWDKGYNVVVFFILLVEFVLVQVMFILVQQPVNIFLLLLGVVIGKAWGLVK